jgi:hypothetical protein
MGTAGIEVYEKLEALAASYLEREYTGSVKSNYNTMKCLDLFDSDELDRLARDSAKCLTRPSQGVCHLQRRSWVASRGRGLQTQLVHGAGARQGTRQENLLRLGLTGD